MKQVRIKPSNLKNDPGKTQTTWCIHV